MKVFGPEKVAVIVETLTENKNRTASKIEQFFKKLVAVLELKALLHII